VNIKVTTPLTLRYQVVDQSENNEIHVIVGTSLSIVNEEVSYSEVCSASSSLILYQVNKREYSQVYVPV
jgi:hypothetical protein